MVAAIVIAAFNAFGQEVSLPSTLVDPGTPLVLVKSGLGFGEGPAWDTKTNTLFFTEPRDNEIWNLLSNGQTTLWRSASNAANGLVVDAQGALIACEKGMVTRTLNGQRATLVQGVGNDVNDITLASDKGFFFTNPVWDGIGDVYYTPPSGPPKVIVSRVSGYPNGIEYLEERQELYISYTQANVVRRYPVKTDRTLGTPTDFIPSINTPDGFALDELGNFWIAAHRDVAIYVYSPQGVKLGSIKMTGPATVENCAFGGADFKTLFITCDGSLYKIALKVKGRPTSGAVAVRRDMERHVVPGPRHGSGNIRHGQFLLNGSTLRGKAAHGLKIIRHRS